MKQILFKGCGTAISTPFDEKGQNVTWESSSVREWLNKDLFRIGASSLVGDIEKRLGK